MNHSIFKVSRHGDMGFYLKIGDFALDLESVNPLEIKSTNRKGLFSGYVGYFRLRIGYSNSLFNIHLRG